MAKTKKTEEFYVERENGTTTRPATSMEIHGLKYKEYSPAEVEKNGPETKNGVVTNCVHVRMRKTPTSNGDVVAILGKETKVEILGEENGFYKVSIIGLSNPGYIMSKYIKEE